MVPIVPHIFQKLIPIIPHFSEKGTPNSRACKHTQRNIPRRQLISSAVRHHALAEFIKKVKMGYTLDGAKIKNLLCLNDLKLFVKKNENEFESLKSTVNFISVDTDRYGTLDKHVGRCGLKVK